MSIRTADPRARRGSIYLLVLGTTTVIAALVGGTLYAQSMRVKSEQLSADAAQARFAALSGIDVARAWIAQDANWRTTWTSGRWATDLALGTAKVNIDVIDTIDGNLSNHPYHPVKITATARIGQAEQIFTANLVAKPTPIDSLAYALHTAGQLRVAANKTVRLGTGTISTNGALRNQNVIEGNVLAGSVTTAGTVYGSTTISGTPRSFPSTASIDQLIAMGTVIVTSNLSGITLSPTSNPYGAANALGIYVINASNDFKIKNADITGTVIVTVPAGKLLTFEGINTLRPASSDLPMMVVRGDAEFKAPAEDDVTGVGTTFSGLLHVTKTLKVSRPAIINGLVLCESTASTDAVAFTDDTTIKYDPGLYSYPPVGYASRVDMTLVVGSIQRLVK